ncbi:MAG: ribonuclease P protein component [Bacteroidetes bacterium]|nr:ribonuclease P protein component [Bacteroidota bacterium]
MAKATALSLGAPRRLKREQQIETLFREGKAFSVFPIRFVWNQAVRGGETEPLRVGFSVSKKKFKRALDRGRVKRLMKETFRHHQSQLWPLIASDTQIHLFLIYTATELPDFHSLNHTMQSGIEKLKKMLGNA